MLHLYHLRHLDRLIAAGNEARRDLAKSLGFDRDDRKETL